MEVLYNKFRLNPPKGSRADAWGKRIKEQTDERTDDHPYAVSIEESAYI